MSRKRKSLPGVDGPPLDQPDDGAVATASPPRAIAATPEQLIEARQNIKASLVEAAALLGTTPQILQRIESGNEQLTEDLAERMDEIYALDAPIRDGQVDVEVQHIPLDQIERPLNHREADSIDVQAVRQLAASMGAAGLHQPVCVAARRGGTSVDGGKPYALVFGYRRCAAAELLGWESIPARVLEDADEATIEAARAAENIERQQLTDWEQAEAIARVADRHGGDVARTSAATGWPEAWIRDRLYIYNRCCPDVRRIIAEGWLTLGHARELAKVGDPKDQLSLARQAGGLPWDWPKTKGRDVHPSTGHVNRLSIQRLRQRVDDLQRKLRVVPWELDQPMGTLPPCIGCEHNTATDQTLFGMEDVGDGACMNAGCFNQKTARAEKQKQKVVDKIVGKKLEPTAEQIDKLNPPWLKRAPVQRLAKKAATPTPESPGAAQGAQAASAGKSKRSTKAGQLSPEEQARFDFGAACDRWDADVLRQFDAATATNPIALFAVLLIYESPWGSRWAGDYSRKTSWRPHDGGPIPEPDAPLARLIDRLGKAAVEDPPDSHLIEAARMVQKVAGNGRSMAVHDLLEDIDLPTLACLAQKLSIEIPPLPTLEQFMPQEPERAEPAAEPQKKSKRKKSGKSTRKSKAKA